MSAISLMFSGIGGTAISAFQFTKGRIQSGMHSMFLGLTATNVGGRLHGLDPRTLGEIMRCSLTVVAGTMGVLGAIQLTKGVKQKSISEIIKGAITTLAGVAGSVLAYNLDSRIIVAAHQASVLGLTSSFIGALGFKDLVKGHYRSGLCKIALGTAGVASTAYYVYNCYFQTIIALSNSERISFIESHKGEIEEMYETQTKVGRWKKLGEGLVKTTFTHEDFPGWVIKIPNAHYPEYVRIFHKNFEDIRDIASKSVRIHHENLEDIRGIASKFDRISLPESYLYPTAKGVVLVEEMFKLEPYKANTDQQEAGKQLNNFVQTVGLCDIDPEVSHNAGILAGTIPPRMGIIDVDCRSKV